MKIISQKTNRIIGALVSPAIGMLEDDSLHRIAGYSMAAIKGRGRGRGRGRALPAGLGRIVAILLAFCSLFWLGCLVSDDPSDSEPLAACLLETATTDAAGNPAPPYYVCYQETRQGNLDDQGCISRADRLESNLSALNARVGYTYTVSYGCEDPEIDPGLQFEPNVVCRGTGIDTYYMETTTNPATCIDGETKEDL